MEINTNLNAARVERTPAQQPAVRNSTVTSDTAVFSGAQSLAQALENVSDLRVEAVERARALISQIDYPPQETIRKLANLFAMHLDSNDESKGE